MQVSTILREFTGMSTIGERCARNLEIAEHTKAFVGT